MLTVSVANTKGGTGKTTTAMYLALAYAQAGRPVLVIDLDKQGSASDWADRAADSGEPLPFRVEVGNMTRIKRMVDTPRADDDSVIIIDTPPGDGQVIDVAVSLSDFVILPTQPTGLDISRVWQTLPTVADRPHGVLITAARLGTSLLDQTRAAFDSQGTARFDTVIPMRETYRQSFGLTPRSIESYKFVMEELDAALEPETNGVPA